MISNWKMIYYFIISAISDPSLSDSGEYSSSSATTSQEEYLPMNPLQPNSIAYSDESSDDENYTRMTPIKEALDSSHSRSLELLSTPDFTTETNVSWDLNKAYLNSIPDYETWGGGGGGRGGGGGGASMAFLLPPRNTLLLENPLPTLDKPLSPPTRLPIKNTLIY